MCEINQIHIVPVDVMKIKLFAITLGDRAKDWFLNFWKEFTTKTTMEEKYITKYYFLGKTPCLRKTIREFTQGLSETFHEA